MLERMIKALAVAGCAALLIDAAPIAEGWVQVASPLGNFVSSNCANLSGEDRGVSFTGGGLRIGRAYESDAPKTIALGKGRLEGIDRGEWGGELDWIAPDGSRTTLLKDDIHGLVPIASGILVLAGLDHLGISRGSLYLVAPSDGAPAPPREIAKLAASADTYAVASDGSVLVLTSEGLYRTSPEGDTKKVAALDTSEIGALSLAVSENGTVYVGMRHYIVALIPRGGAYEQQWWGPRQCPVLTREDRWHGDCHCVAQP
ncbi:MAG TPA: hypothetical protein VFV07_01215 [Rhizomicrobium sp.]|nr:hypothetical protein [Rhizomicrobium sp.]